MNHKINYNKSKIFAVLIELKKSYKKATMIRYVEKEREINKLKQDKKLI